MIEYHTNMHTDHCFESIQYVDYFRRLPHHSQYRSDRRSRQSTTDVWS